MKIAIIGGGFYGSYFAYKLLKNKKFKIHLFEKNKQILSETAINNQYRLHTGYHYPRSSVTINQTIQGYKNFVYEFRNFLFFPKKNLYFIHKTSKVSFNEYIKIFKSFNLNFDILNKNDFKSFVNIKKMEGVINTEEGVIILEKLIKFFKKSLFSKIKIYNFTKILKIDSNSGSIFSEKKVFHNYDLIINTTYTNPNLGLKNSIDVKYELNAMVKLKNPFKLPIGLTIMDGKYCSLYPQNTYFSTISSVLYTPISKFNKYDEILNKKKLINPNLVKEKIISHSSKYLNLPRNLENVSLIIGNKVKIKNDNNDQRLSIIKKNKKVISILCGKLDAVTVIYNQLLRMIEKL